LLIDFSVRGSRASHGSRTEAASTTPAFPCPGPSPPLMNTISTRSTITGSGILRMPID
jgi:hypothetical protein